MVTTENNCCMSGLAGSLVRSLFCGLNQERRLAVFVAFSDESGTGDIEGVFLVGGFVAKESYWGQYADLWNNRILSSSPKIKHLHMREIRREEFQKENKLTSAQADEKVSLATELLSEIAAGAHPGSPVIHSVLSVIQRSDLWDMLLLLESQGIRVPSGTMDLPDYLCFFAYAETVLNFTRTLFPDTEKIDFVVSRNGKITGHYKTYVDDLHKRWPEPGLIGDVLPVDPITRNPLQMADVLCWHHRRYYEDGTVDDNMTRLMQVRTFTHDWKRRELEAFTERLIASQR